MSRLKSRNAKTHVLQTRLSDADQQRLMRIKGKLHATSNSEAVRLMIQDECILSKIVKEMQAGHDIYRQVVAEQWSQYGRLDMAKAALGLRSKQGTQALAKVSQQYQKLDDLAASLNWQVTRLSTNVNQISHVLNQAKQADELDNDKVWSWVEMMLNKLQPAIQTVHCSSQKLQAQLEGDGNDGSYNDTQLS